MVTLGLLDVVISLFVSLFFINIVIGQLHLHHSYIRPHSLLCNCFFPLFTNLQKFVNGTKNIEGFLLR